MTDKEIIISKLQVFKRYGFKSWGGTIEFYEVDFNSFRQGVELCIDELIEAIGNDASKRELKGVIKPYIDHLRHLQISETEEREYVSQIYYDLSQIISTDVTFAINRVIYGWLLTILTTNPFRKKNKIIDPKTIYKTLINECISCKCEMITNIINSDRANIGELEVTMHALVACKVCGELNLVFITEDGEIAHSYDYYLIEEFPSGWTLEQAQQRMDQVRQWRKA